MSSPVLVPALNTSLQTSSIILSWLDLLLGGKYLILSVDTENRLIGWHRALLQFLIRLQILISAASASRITDYI